MHHNILLCFNDSVTCSIFVAVLMNLDLLINFAAGRLIIHIAFIYDFGSKLFLGSSVDQHIAFSKPPTADTLLLYIFLFFNPKAICLNNNLITKHSNKYNID